MKTENEPTAAELKPARGPADAKQPAVKKAGGVRKQPKSDLHLPLLLEFTYTLSAVIVLLLAIMVITTSILTGASLLALVLRTGVASLGMGALLMLISSQISSGLLFAARIEQEDAQLAAAADEIRELGEAVSGLQPSESATEVR